MNKIKYTFLLFTILFFCENLSAQVNISTEGTINICSGTWTDSNGALIGNNYDISEDFTQTLCPDVAGQVISVDFTSFSTERGIDILTYYNDDAVVPANILGSSSGTELNGITLFGNITPDNPNGCLTFVWTSDLLLTDAGWEATLSCVTPCSIPTGVMTSNTDAIECSTDALVPGSAVSFDASGSTAAAGFSLTRYDWDFGDGTTQETATATTTHTYATAGIYLASVIVRDNNTNIDPEGCASTNAATRVVIIPDVPDFSATSADITIDCGQTASLDGIVTSTPLLQTPPTINIDPIALPDGGGISYDVPLDYTGFFPNGALVTATCLPEVCVNLEHSFANDLTIDLVAPGGVSIRLMDRGNNGDLFGTCVNASDDEVPGCTAQYCFVNAGGANIIGAATPGAPGNCAAYAGPCQAGDYIPAGSYNSLTPLSDLIGFPLNGVWTIRVTDNQAVDDGSIDGAALNFPLNCYNPLLADTPDINIDATTGWTANPGNPSNITIPAQTNNSVPFTTTNPLCDNITPADGCTGNTVTNTINPTFNVPGVYTFTYTATDEYGCAYEEEVVVTVNDTGSCPAPPACEPNNGTMMISIEN